MTRQRDRARRASTGAEGVRGRRTPLRLTTWATLVLGALAIVAASCRSAPPADVQVDVRNVGFDHEAGAPVVILQAREDEARVLPIWIGPAEAQAIALEMQNVTPPRPLTHDLMKRILESTGTALVRVRITGLEAQTYLAKLVLERDHREIEVDSRPSDAIALALRVDCPILVAPALFDRSSGRETPAPPRDLTAKLWGLTLQDVTPALADSLGLPHVSGVLVSDVADPAVPSRRGDVIVAVDDVAIADLAGLRAFAESHRAPQRLEVERSTARVSLTFDHARARDRNE